VRMDPPCHRQSQLQDHFQARDQHSEAGARAYAENYVGDEERRTDERHAEGDRTPAEQGSRQTPPDPAYDPPGTWFGEGSPVPPAPPWPPPRPKPIPRTPPRQQDPELLSPIRRSSTFTLGNDAGHVIASVEFQSPGSADVSTARLCGLGTRPLSPTAQVLRSGHEFSPCTEAVSYVSGSCRSWRYIGGPHQTGPNPPSHSRPGDGIGPRSRDRNRLDQLADGTVGKCARHVGNSNDADQFMTVDDG
jgi:hypothetical protein